MASSIWKHGSFKNSIICGNPSPALVLWVTGILMACGSLISGMYPLPMTERDVIKAAGKASSPGAAACIKKTAADTMRAVKKPLGKHEIYPIGQLCEAAVELHHNRPVEGSRRDLMAKCLFGSSYWDSIHDDGGYSPSRKEDSAGIETRPVSISNVFFSMRAMSSCSKRVDAELAAMRTAEAIEQTKPQRRAGVMTPAHP